MSSITITKYLSATHIYRIALIHQGSGWSPNETGKGSILETGPKQVLLNTLIDLVDSAQEVICFQSFLMQDSALFEALKRAAQRGVRVYALGAAEARLENHNEEEEDYKKEQYIDLLKKSFKGNFVFRTAHYFHAKYILIDPKSEEPRGALLTCNLTLNAFQINPELGVLLNHKQISELFEIFVYHFWEHAEHQYQGTNQFAPVRPAAQLKPRSWSNVLLTSPNTDANTLMSNLVTAVNKASNSIVISAFSFEQNHELCKAIMNRAKQGVKVTVFSPPRLVNLDGFCKQIVLAGGKVVVQELLHAKFLVTDEKTAFVFTANFASIGLDSGMEVGVLLSDTQTKELNAVIDAWNKNLQFQLKVDASAEKIGIGKFSIIGKDGKLIQKEIMELDQFADKKPLKDVAELRRAVLDLQARQPNHDALKTEFTLRLDASDPPETQTREAIAKGVLKITFKDKSGQRHGILITQDFIPASMDKIELKWNQWPIFI